MARTSWELPPADKSSVKRLSYGLGISRVTASVLVARGIVDEAIARSFVEPRLDDLGDLSLIPDIKPALERLKEAVAHDEHIMVIGHDDADGITSTTIVFGSLREIGADVSYYIPDSPTEGIGLSREIVDRFKASGVSLVITVDCGVSNKEEVAYASTVGIDVIITDHHEPPDELPPAVAVVDLKRHDSRYGFRDLAGCGIAYRFMEAFAEDYRKIGTPPTLEGMLGMAALGSYADRVPLRGENRIIVYHGVREIVSRKLIPFSTLRSHIWVDDESTLSEVLWKMVPLVGASRSREGGNLGCELLLATEQDDAEEIFSQLVMEVEKKREMGRKSLARVMDRLKEIDPDSHKGLVLQVDRLPGKTVGYCAARLTDTMNKPVAIVSMRGETGVGELRSPKGFDLVEALRAHKHLFTDFGGHKQAAGFSIKQEHVEEFMKSFTLYLDEKVDPKVIQKKVKIDGKLDAGELTLDGIKSLLVLEPFGQENQRPVFLLESLHPGVIKEVEGTLRIGEVTLTGEKLGSEDGWDACEGISMVVSPFCEGSIKAVEVIDWRKTEQRGGDT
jgi:single-stranded-DNA-specific exonuclease